MSLFLKLFNTTAEYNAYTADTSNFILPNVSVCKDQANVVHYNPYVEPQETRLVCKYNVTSTSSPTALRTNYEQNVFKSMEIDGVMLDNLVTEYTFDNVGIHSVKYELYDETKLGNQAPVFYNGNLVECIIPNSVTSIGSYAFNSCSGITSVTIGSSVTSIGERAFMACFVLTSIIIPDSITSISDEVFNGCTSLTSITIPNSVTSIGNNAFLSCTGLTSIDIPDSVTSIGGGAFQYCSRLSSCTIGSGVTTIGDYAFYQCSDLTSLTVEATIPPTLGNDAFVSTSNYPIYVPSGSVDTYKSASGWSTYASRIQAIP